MAPMVGYEVEPFDTERWHPRSRLVYEYWRRLKPAHLKNLSRAAFDAFEIPGALGWLWMLDIGRDPFRLRCRLFGTLVGTVVGEDITGQYLDQSPLSDPQRPIDEARLRKTAFDGVPTWARTRPIMRHGDIWAEVESLFLPLADDGEHPDILLAVSVFYRADGTDA